LEYTDVKKTSRRMCPHEVPFHDYLCSGDLRDFPEKLEKYE